MSTPGTQPLTAGWYPDPAGTGGQRWHDGQGWTAQVVHGIPTVKALGHGFARLGDWLGRMLAAWGVIYLLLGLLMLALWMVGPDAFAPTGTAGTGTELTTPTQSGTGTESALALVIDVVFFALFLATVVTWLVWQYQLAAAAPVQLRHSPASHVFWWFVPLASLVMPRRAIGELWHAYSTRRTAEPSQPTPAVFSIWWALWLSPTLLIVLQVVAVFTASSVDGALSRLLGFSALLMLAYAGAGFAARRVVRGLSWRALLYHSTAS
jgi:hypothetical protein